MTASPAAATIRRSSRLVALLVGLGVALALLVSPTAAHASTATALTATNANRWAAHMLATLNAERKAHHLPAVKMNSKLVRSAHAHNADMAKKNTMSHQLPGEAFFATRITKAGYKWRAAGENIGWNSNQSDSGLQALERAMYNEKPPNDGHRVNILSSTFREIGIDVYFDKAHHKMWYTQDFGRAA
jgi:uncharacterized protein YkwD